MPWTAFSLRVPEVNQQRPIGGPNPTHTERLLGVIDVEGNPFTFQMSKNSGRDRHRYSSLMLPDTRLLLSVADSTVNWS